VAWRIPTVSLTSSPTLIDCAFEAGLQWRPPRADRYLVGVAHYIVSSCAFHQG